LLSSNLFHFGLGAHLTADVVRVGINFPRLCCSIWKSLPRVWNTQE